MCGPRNPPPAPNMVNHAYCFLCNLKCNFLLDTYLFSYLYLDTAIIFVHFTFTPPPHLASLSMQQYISECVEGELRVKMTILPGRSVSVHFDGFRQTEDKALDISSPFAYNINGS